MSRTVSNAKPKLSEFAQALSRLLDQSGFYTREEWARFLGISTAAISQWVHDKTIPRADLLRMVLDLLRTRGGEAASEPLKNFEKLLGKPALEVSPLGKRMSPTVKDYLRQSSFAGLGKELRGLSPEQQVKVLRSGSWELSAVNEESSSVKYDRKTHERPYQSEHSVQLILPDLMPLGSAQRFKRFSWEKITEHPHCLIVGSPGSGKSFILSALANQYRSQNEIRSISARSFAHHSASDFSSLFHEAPDNCVVLIDGFDELLPQKRRNAVRQIVNGTKSRQAIKCVVTSRPTPELDEFRGFDCFSPAPLSTTQIILFLSQSMNEPALQNASSREVRQFIWHLMERPSLRDLFGRPLFLAIARKLFEHNALTPFFETNILGEFVKILLERDHEKDVVRMREPWALPTYLMSALGSLSFHSLLNEQHAFSIDSAVGWVKLDNLRAPIDELLSLLEIQGLLTKHGKSYSFVHQSFSDYFAALYVVESAEKASDYLTDWGHKNSLRDVVRMACGITNDATPILRGILESDKVSEASRCSMLAEILAQPLTAEISVIEQSCDDVVGWLDKTLKGWAIDPETTEDSGDTDISWELSASGLSIGEVQAPTQKALSAIHRARSGDTRTLLQERMTDSSSVVLPQFAESMDVDGTLNLKFSPHNGREKLRATVGQSLDV